VTELTTENRGIGLVFQNYALYPHMTVKQNILFPLQNLKGADKLSKAEMDKRALEDPDTEIPVFLKDGTQLLFVGDEETIRLAFNIKGEENCAFLPKIMSRKKQVIPTLSALWG